MLERCCKDFGPLVFPAAVKDRRCLGLPKLNGLPACVDGGAQKEYWELYSLGIPRYRGA